jgi:hypothetical protein
MRGFGFVAVIALATMAFDAPAAACKCIAPTEANVLSNATIGVEGEVIGLKRVGGRNAGRLYATIRVARVLKGRVPRTIIVETRGNSAACGVDFQMGQTYRFGASSAGRNYSVSACSVF